MKVGEMGEFTSSISAEVKQDCCGDKYQSLQIIGWS
jgi:hypothetical protein